MLVSFIVENYLSLKDRVRLDLTAGSIKEFQNNVHSRINYFPDERLLKSIALYGSNSSGKSNLLKAFGFVRTLILNSSKESHANRLIDVEPFRLSQQTENKPSKFEIEFIVENIKYLYGFSTTNKKVVAEFLFIVNKRKKYETIFIRENEQYDFSKTLRTSELKAKLQMLTEVTRTNALFLSVLAQFNVDIAKRLFDWFDNAGVIHNSIDSDLINYTASLLKDKEYNSRINSILINSDLGITHVDAISKGKKDKSKFDEFLTAFFSDENYLVTTSHRKYNEAKYVATSKFELLKNESLGTQKFFGLLGPIITCLKKGSLLWIDELDSSFHTLMLEVVLKLFNSTMNNPNGAQLVFTLHNTDPLKRILRRDQMIFFHKDELGVTTFDSLSNSHPKVRSDASFEKEYLLGKYGAIPKLNSQLDLFGNVDELT